MANDKKKKPNSAAPSKPKTERKHLTGEEKVAFWKLVEADKVARYAKNAELSEADRTKRKDEKVAKVAAAKAALAAVVVTKPAPVITVAPVIGNKSKTGFVQFSHNAPPAKLSGDEQRVANTPEVSLAESLTAKKAEAIGASNAETADRAAALAAKRATPK